MNYRFWDVEIAIKWLQLPSRFRKLFKKKKKRLFSIISSTLTRGNKGPNFFWIVIKLITMFFTCVYQGLKTEIKEWEALVRNLVLLIYLFMPLSTMRILRAMRWNQEVSLWNISSDCCYLLCTHITHNF